MCTRFTLIRVAYSFATPKTLIYLKCVANVPLDSRTMAIVRYDFCLQINTQQKFEIILLYSNSNTINTNEMSAYVKLAKQNLNCI